MPTLTPYMPLWIRTDATWKTEHRLSFEKMVLKSLIEQLPSVLYFFQLYPPQFQNWLPFWWKGYNIEPLMNYIIDDLQDSKKVWQNLKTDFRNKINKAEKKGISIESRNDLDAFYTLFTKAKDRIGFKTHTTKPLLYKIHEEIKSRDAGKIFFAIDADKNILAALYVVWDTQKATYWIPLRDEKAGNSGATSLLLWTILKELGQRNITQFQAAGSMEKNLESFITGFGARQETYWKMTHYGNRFIAFLYFLKRQIRL